MFRNAVLTTIGFLLLGSPLPVSADPGQVEINQTCAVETGCFTGDTPGFPVTIGSGGSYRLTSNLDLKTEPSTVSAIDVTSSDTTIDLGGFSLRGPNTCTGTGATLSCSLSSGGNGIVLAFATRGVTIQNGSIIGFGNFGIWSGGEGHRIERITARHNGFLGIVTDPQTIVTDSIANENGQKGFDVDGGSVVENCIASGNGGDGIEVDGTGTTVQRTVSRGNGGHGFNFTVGLGKFGRDNISDGNGASDRCGGGICTVRRRYYLTIATFDGSQPAGSGVCATGFHFASFFEIRDPTQLAYDYTLGLVRPDSGLGPPASRLGWVRTGADDTAFGVSAPLGVSNCSAWTSNGPAENGAAVQLESDWRSTAENSSPWSGIVVNCSQTLAARAWCVEDH